MHSFTSVTALLVQGHSEHEATWIVVHANTFLQRLFRVANLCTKMVWGDERKPKNPEETHMDTYETMHGQ